MPIERKDLDGGLGSLIVGQGDISEEEYIDFYSLHFGQDEDKFRKYRYNITDFSAITEKSITEIPSEAVRKMAQLCEGASEINPEGVIAVVAGPDAIYGLSRMWEILVDDTPWETMVFRKIEDAKVWIKEKVKKKYGIDNLTFG